MAATVSDILKNPPQNAENKFAQFKTEYPLLVSHIELIESDYNKKLYHNLTESVIDFVNQNLWVGERDVELLYTLLYPINEKLNVIRLCDIFIILSDRLEPEAQLLLLDKFETICSTTFTSMALVEILKAGAYIKKGELEKAYNILFESLSSLFGRQLSIDIKVNAQYHMTCLEYYKATKNPNKIYHHLLLYIAYKPLDEIPHHIRQQLAFEACASGLISDDMFNLGELLMMPLLTCLDVPEKKWILKLLESANEGNYQQMAAVCKEYELQLKETFGDKLASFEEKVTLTVLLELAFQQPKTSHFLTFQQIHEHCFIPLDKVEHCLIRAINLNLIKGSIDQVAQQIDLTWVKPRMIDLQRVSQLKDQFQGWSENLQTLISELETTTSEMFSA